MPPPSPKLLITAGPTHEPIDAVRYIGNRSSGRLGIALADAAAHAGWDTTILLGPVNRAPQNPAVRVVPFQSTADLEARLAEHFPKTDVLVMAAAVSDYRPTLDTEDPSQTKMRRGSGPLQITLEPTPDLLAGCAENAKAHPARNQLLVGFALEPRERLESSATRKLIKKNIHAIVANPLETMDAANIEAQLFLREGLAINHPLSTAGPIDKADFAPWLLERIQALRTATTNNKANADATT